MIKTLCKLEIQGNFFNLIKGSYEKPIATIIFNGKRWKFFLLRSGKRKKGPLSPLLFDIVLLEVLARVIS